MTPWIGLNMCTCHPGAIPVWPPVSHFPRQYCLGPLTRIRYVCVGHPTACFPYYQVHQYTVSAAYRRPRGVSVPLAGEVQVRIDPLCIQFRNPSCSESHSPSIWGGCVSYPSNFCPAVVRSWENFDQQMIRLDGSSRFLQPCLLGSLRNFLSILVTGTNCNELGDLGVGWNPNRPTTAIQVSKEHIHNPVMV